MEINVEELTKQRDKLLELANYLFFKVNKEICRAKPGEGVFTDNDLNQIREAIIFCGQKDPSQR